MQPHDAPTYLSPLGSLIGRTLLGRYHLLDRLGSGGMATVFRGRDLRLGRLVAVKVLYPQYAGDEVFLKRFQREAEFAARLTGHPHIVSVYDVGRDGDLPFIVMELVEGPNLKDLILDGAPFPVGRAFQIAGQVGAALHFAHGHGLVHRDVKPHNILVSDGDLVKVTDFGIAWHAAVSGLTRPGAVIGTADYISPEQARGRPATPASDVYALGVVLYEMLTGRLPFAADTPLGLAGLDLPEEPPSPHLLNLDVGPVAAGIVMRALSKDLSERYGNAAELTSALEGAVAAQPARTAALDESGSATSYRPLADGQQGYAGVHTRPALLRSPRSLLLASLSAALLAGLLMAGWLSRGVTSSHPGLRTPSPPSATKPPTAGPAQPAVVLHPNPTRTATPEATSTVAPSPDPTVTTAFTAQPSPSPLPSWTSLPTATAQPPALAPPIQPPSGPGEDKGPHGHDHPPGGDNGSEGHGDQQGSGPPGNGGDG